MESGITLGQGSRDNAQEREQGLHLGRDPRIANGKSCEDTDMDEIRSYGSGGEARMRIWLRCDHTGLAETRG